ncbi:LysR substrate-binding domain-containing protein, partial [Klebsiella pneumoniae]
PICWIDSAERPHMLLPGPSQPSLPLVAFPVGALYRQEMLHALESIGQAWRITYSSPSLASLCAAVSAGLGVSLLPA